MSFFLPEPPNRHEQARRTGVLLINLGTPEAPTSAALRAYLKEFLWDRRVVEIPRVFWWPILNGVILTTRPKHSAEKYASIWTPEGSPLLVHTERLAGLLREELARRAPVPVLVEYAMRYGHPSVAAGLEKLKEQGCDRVLALPLYPQYAASSSGTALDAVYQVLLRMRNAPELRTVRHFHDHPGYIAALRYSVERHWAEYGRPEMLLMSFHGVPRRSLDLGDPYHCECRKTARLLAESLGLTEKEYRLAFQSRFGRAQWLKPYMSEVLTELGGRKMRRVDVICPGFVADCLETLEEIAIEGKATFLNAGGGEYHYIPALNERAPWCAALADLVLSNLVGWLPDAWEKIVEDRESELRVERARRLESKE